MISSAGGSPAEKAGLPNQEKALVSVDDIPASHDPAQIRTQLQHLALMNMGPDKGPLTIRYEGDGGQIQTVTIAHQETYMFHPDALPQPPPDKFVVLYFHIHGNSLALQESPLSLQPFIRPPDTTDPQLIAGRKVFLTGPADAQGAHWAENNVDFQVDNASSAISSQDLVRLISSMPVGEVGAVPAPLHDGGSAN